MEHHMKTILLAESEKHVLDALRLAIEQRAELKVVGEARSAESLLAQVCQHAPDIILLDWNLPGLCPQRLIHTLRGCCPATILAALSVKPEDEQAVREHGLDGFISKQLPAESFIAALNQILSRPKGFKETQ
ncbi:MAG: response regulator transcription factor [Anaerolinea sp.]|nr:response regulator transcription factor [Anaerolinea sp.]